MKKLTNELVDHKVDHNNTTMQYLHMHLIITLALKFNTVSCAINS